MPFSLIPRGVYPAVTQISPKALAEKGVRLVLADLDNTLVPYRVTEPSQAVRQWRDALAAEGMAALDAYPDQRARRYGCPVAAVAVETAESWTVGFCNYLGEVFDTGAGAPRELYGKQLEAVISIEIRGQRAADCEQGCETAAEVLLERLPAGIRPGELNWEALTWERETGLFLRRGRLRCRAYFLARAEEGDTVFLDFRLKGAVTT